MKEYAGKRVLIIVENLPVPFDRRVWQEAIALKEKGAEVSIICPIGKGYKKKKEILEGIKIYRHSLILEAGKKWGYLLEYASALFWEVVLAWWIYFKDGFDAIHACNPPDLIFLVALPFKILGKKFIFDHHDLNPELYLAKFKNRDVFYKILFLLEKMTFRLADLSIATNNSYKDIAIKRGKMKDRDVYVVRSGPDLKRIKRYPQTNEYKKGKRFLVGYVGVIGKQEGLDYLIDAMHYIAFKRGRKDIYCVCVGSGPYLELAKGKVHQEMISDYITFTGRVSDEILFKILGSADVCVNPDEYNEMNNKSTMNKIMEYMCLGKPIVQFDLKEGRFSAQSASLYARSNDSVDLAEKILELIDNPKKREEMGRLGCERIKNELSWEKGKNSLYSVYDRLFLDRDL